MADDATPYVILVIEDEVTILENILEVLRLNDYEVHGASNGAEGLEVAQKILPDLIICDINMPEIDGYNVLMSLRSNALTSQIPLIFLTAFVDYEFQRRGMTLGASDYLTKPFTSGEILDAVTTQIEKSKENREEIQQLRDNLLHSLPHELRTPLAGIITCAELLLMDIEEGSLDASRAEQTLQIIKQSGRRLQVLIEKQLLYSQIEIQSSDRDRRADVRGEEGVEGIRSFIEMIAMREATYADRIDDLKIGDHADGNIRISTSSLETIFTELIDNAFKFSKPGQSVWVSSELKDGKFHLSVVDEGRGMRSEDILKIGAYMQFERERYEQQGLGLGLAIVKGLVELHEGEFIIEQCPEGGTKATVILNLMD